MRWWERGKHWNDKEHGETEENRNQRNFTEFITMIESYSHWWANGRYKKNNTTKPQIKVQNTNYNLSGYELWIKTLLDYPNTIAPIALQNGAREVSNFAGNQISQHEWCSSLVCVTVWKGRCGHGSGTRGTVGSPHLFPLCHQPAPTRSCSAKRKPKASDSCWLAWIVISHHAIKSAMSGQKISNSE